MAEPCLVAVVGGPPLRPGFHERHRRWHDEPGQCESRDPDPEARRRVVPLSLAASEPPAISRWRGWTEMVLVALGFSSLTAILTYPLAFRLGSIGRVDNGDGQFSIWNVAWVARALVLDPLHVFDANIFYPH